VGSARGSGRRASAAAPSSRTELKRYLSDLNLSGIPATLREYLSRVVTPTLERQKNGGALALKFEAAYLRALDFAEANEAEAARVYARYARGDGEPSIAEYKPLQDFLFLVDHAAADGDAMALAAVLDVTADLSSLTRLYRRVLASLFIAGAEGRPPSHGKSASSS